MVADGHVIDLRSFQVQPERGFLPRPDPLMRLPREFAPWEELARELPKLLAAGRFRGAAEGLPVLDAGGITGAEAERAMVLLSFFGHAYVWGEASPAGRIPAAIGVP